MLDYMKQRGAHYSAGKFRALTGLSEKALRLYGDRGLLVPALTDPATSYRSYSSEQVKDGITLDLLRRAHVPLDEMAGAKAFSFQDRRARLVLERAMEDTFLDIAELVANGDADTLVVRAVEVPPTDWVSVDVPLALRGDLEEQASAIAGASLGWPELDRALTAASDEESIPLEPESWTMAIGGDDDSRVRLAHRVVSPIHERSRIRVAHQVAALHGDTVRVSAGTLPERHEVSFAYPGSQHLEDDHLADTALSYLAIVAFAHFVAEHGVTALLDTARRQVSSTHIFDPAAIAQDVYDVSGFKGAYATPLSHKPAWELPPR